MNLSHVITEFSFGPYFPEIAQPLDYSFEIAKERTFFPFSVRTQTHRPQRSWRTNTSCMWFRLHILPPEVGLSRQTNTV
jgi:hypothetical protein